MMSRYGWILPGVLVCAFLSYAQQQTTSYSSSLPGLSGALAAQKDAQNAADNGAPRQAYWLAAEALRLAGTKLAPNDPRLAPFHYHLGFYALQLGLDDISHAQVGAALAAYKPGSAERAPTLQTLANIDALRGLPEEALGHAKEALAASSVLGQPMRDIESVQVLDQMGRLLQRLGRLPEADATFDDAIKRLQNSLITDVLLPGVLEDAAGVDISLKRYDSANKRLVMARSLLGSGPASATTLTTGIEAKTAMVQAALGDLNAAELTLERSFELADRVLKSSLKSGDSEDPRTIELLRQMSDELDVAVTLDETYGDHSATIRQLAVTLSASRVGFAQDLTVRLAGLLRDEAVGEDVGQLKRLANLRSELASVIRARWRSGGGYEERIRTLDGESLNIERALLDRHPDVIDAVDAPDLGAVKRGLGEETAVLLFVRFARPEGAPAYRAYIIERDEPVAAVTLGDCARIDDAAQKFRASLEKPSLSGPQERLDRARAVGELVWDPIEKSVGGAKRLVIVPDDELSLTSFSALLDSKGAFVGAERSITYLSSVRQLVHSASTPAASGAMHPVIFADPDYGSRSKDSDQWQAVPETEDIPKQIREWLPDAVAYTRADATTQNARLLVSPLFLHIASHAFFDNVPDKMGGFVEDTVEPMLTGGIALAGANRPAGLADGILSPLEIAGVDLRGTELVFISACSTAEGVSRTHEGLYGIRRGLEIGGSRVQILALWNIDTAATIEFVNDFYERWLDKKVPVEEAFFLAQQHVRQFKPAWNDPFYWAGFVLSGDATALK